jgi:hypothetical protein
VPMAARGVGRGLRRQYRGGGQRPASNTRIILAQTCPALLGCLARS